MSKSLSANIARKMSAGCYHPKSVQRESSYEALIVSMRGNQSTKNVRQPAPGSMATLGDFFPGTK